ncbi:hypothetical protein CHS0354_042595 [Potamilus streckersoni]|nr:hypothetical protein CHS0354_042595 [Potamilus streckersoni]
MDSPESVSQFFVWIFRDVIFFSGDVQTTTIAVAITSSLCCSIVLAFLHVLARILPQGQKTAYDRKPSYGFNYSSTSSSKKTCQSLVISYEKVEVPCVKCGGYYADFGCRFVTCKYCCFCPGACHVHKETVNSKPYETARKVRKIDFSHCGMEQCPQRLGFMGAQLTCLNLSENNLATLPAEIGCLRGLQKLSLRNNTLETLPNTLVLLTNLTKFDISRNRFSSLPDCVMKILTLEVLDVSINYLTSLPPSIGGLQLLRKLNLKKNKLTFLTEEVFSLIHLKYLSVKANPLEHLSRSIGNLINLIELNAFACSLTSIPVSIGRCSSLRFLHLARNRLRWLPSQIGQLHDLQGLYLNDNQLSYLPAMITFIPNIAVVSVLGNPLITEETIFQYAERLNPCRKKFPSLLELSARVVYRYNIPYGNTVPSTLTVMLKNVGYCSSCAGPFFGFYSGKIIFKRLTFGSLEKVPLYQQLCSPHNPKGCSHAVAGDAEGTATF